MVQIVIGAAAGLAIAAAGLIGYRLGLKDGAGSFKTRKPDNEGAEQQQDALMKKYELILDYDPYGERV
jgi:hypothetical protein